MKSRTMAGGARHRDIGYWHSPTSAVFVLIRHCEELKGFLKRNSSQFCKFSTTSKRLDLNEFFDDKKNWGETTVYSGRPWRMEELRLKSNVDLHKLWYLLLKERNMLMTMEEEHFRCLERMPNPERFEKVEESMENLLMVVEERNRADDELEKGEWVGPKVVEAVDQLGRSVQTLTSEHFSPKVIPSYAQSDESMWSEKTVNLLRLEREKHIVRRRERQRRQRYFDKLDQWNKTDYLDENSIGKEAA
ncbi:hypothetical protein MN116_007113 [Schistosoma mekongi]|uniref:Large ribosomal subunit protein uL29m n=1 Tax=Schistosoma mekongi TaxID=38744 RepID=A0AAE1Z9X8_SCHME|nr:hypothetical protein MN116_007113 [Schistosoma mekongi]